MSNFLNQIPELPVGDNVENVMDLFTDTFSSVFKFIQNNGNIVNG